MDNKLKKSAKKITMSDDLKERILKKCVSDQSAENNGYEFVFTAERAAKKRMRLCLPIIAACAVAVFGMGIFKNISDTHPEESSLISENNSDMFLYVKEYSSPGSSRITTELTEFFNSMTFEKYSGNIDVSSESIAYTFNCKLNEENNETNIILYHNGILQIGSEDELYIADYDFFRSIGKIITGKYGISGNAAPLADAVNIYFDGYRQTADGGFLDDSQTQRTTELFKRLYWVPISERPVDFYDDNCLIFTEKTNSHEAVLKISADEKNTAEYTVRRFDDTGSEISSKTQFYSIDSTGFFYGFMRIIAGDANIYPPFGSLYKQLSSLEMYADTTVLSLDNSSFHIIAVDDDSVSAHLYQRHITPLSNAFLGWDWSNADENASPDYGKAKVFSVNTDDSVMSEALSSVIVYTDSTVDVSYIGSDKITRYYSIDGGTGELLRAIEASLS